MAITFPIDNDGIWCQIINPDRATAPRPALFLDRDGVVVKEVNYLHRAEDCQLEAGAARIMAAANAANIRVIIVTNQAGIAYGKYGWAEFSAVQDKMLADLATLGAKVDAVFACPHHVKGEGAFHHPDHPARKPNPGMLLRGLAAFNIEKKASVIVGDRETDLRAGLNAGLGGGVHLLTGHGSREGERDAAKALKQADFAIHLADSIDSFDLSGLS